jgi:uncharacterized protein (TIGR02099 family)
MSLLRHSFHVASKQLAYLLIIIATLLTIFIGALYWLSEAIEQRQDKIAVWVSDSVGYPVEIGSAGLYMFALVPKLEVNAVRMLRPDKTTEVLSLEQLYLGLDLISSIQQRELVFNDITLTGLNVAIVRDSYGQFQLQGLNAQDQSSPEIEDLLAWSRLLNRFHLQAITIDYTDLKNTSMSGHYQLVNAIVSQKADRWVITGNARLPSTLANSVQFNAQALLENDDISASPWQLQAKINSLSLDALDEQLVWQDIGIQQGMLNANISSSGIGHRIDSVTTELDLAHCELISKQENAVSAPVKIERLIGKLDWQQQNQSWQLSGHNLQLSVNGEHWPQTDFSVSGNPDGTWLVAGKYLRLSDLTAIALLSSSSPEILRQQKPAGDVEMFTLRYLKDEGITNLAFNLRDGVLLPWQNFPGVTGLTASLSWKDGLGNIDLNSHQITIYPEVWLKKAIFFDSATGVLRLQKNDQDWSFQSQELRVWNDDLTLQLDGDVEQTNDGKILNNLKLTLEEVAVDRWQSYVPEQLLNKQFKDWANNAFLAGKIVDGEIELQGELGAFPYKKSPGKGSFNMMLNIEDVQLHYAPEWPDLIGVNGTISGTGNELLIKSQQGTIANFDFSDVSTTVKLNPSNYRVLVNGDLKGSTAQAIQFLQTSPLRQQFAKATKDFVAAGNSNIHLELAVPITDLDATQVSGSVDFINSQMHSTLLPEVMLSQVNGKLKFNNLGVSAESLKAHLFSEPVNIDVKPKDAGTIVSVEGNIDSKQLEAIWSDRALDSIAGKTSYQLDLLIWEKELGNFYMDIAAQSDLKGFTLDAPKPFGKTSEETRAFKLEAEYSDKDPVYIFQYGELNAVIMADGPVWRGDLRFGSGPPVKLPEHGVKVRGNLTDLSIDDWLEWYEQQTQDASGLPSSINDVSLTIDKLTGFNQKLTTLNISAQKGEQDWQAKIDSDQSKGSIAWPIEFNDSARLKIDLDKLDLSLPETDDNNEESQTTLWPTVDITIGSLTVNQMALGELHVLANREESNWKVDLATLNSEVFIAFVPVGEWKQTAVGDQSHFQLDVIINDVEAYLSNFGYQEVIDAETAEFSLDLSWHDQPFAANYGILNGTANIDIGKGKIKEVEPGAAGRILGLISVTSIPRRLSLDFSDLFSKGFSFSSIIGNFNVAEGQAITDDLIMKGTTATIEVTGSADLVNHQYDQLVKVRPNIASTLPVAGAVAAGPVGLGVGTALLIADKLAGKLFGKGIDKLISYDYQLTGPWHDPQLNALRPEQQ